MTVAAVLVLNLNGESFLEKCFASLRRQTRTDFETWLIDNASVDGSVEFVRTVFPEVKILAMDRNIGFAGAYNRAVESVDMSYVIFLNNDTEVDERWFEYLIQAADENGADLVGSKILSYERQGMILSAGLMMTPAGVAYEMGLGEKDVPDSVHNRPRMVGGVSGASMLARTEIFRKFGGFDEGYFAFCEDLDLCWRLNLMDHKVFYEPRSVVYHWSGGTAGGNTSKTRVYFMQKNMIRTALKNFGFLNLVKALLIAVFYTLFRTLLYAFTLRFDLVNAAWSGSLVILRDLRQVLAQRKIIQKTRIVSDRQLKVRGWISSPWDAACEFYRTRRFFCARQR